MEPRGQHLEEDIAALCTKSEQSDSSILALPHDVDSWQVIIYWAYHVTNEGKEPNTKLPSSSHSQQTPGLASHALP